LLRPVPVARVESNAPAALAGAMKPRGYPAPTSGSVSVAIQGGPLKFGGWYIARLHMPDGETRCCMHRHESRAGARDCGWRLRTVAIQTGELPVERVLWVTGTREPG
jgi:hypothetical protein